MLTLGCATAQKARAVMPIIVGPYVGVTGFTTPEQVATALAASRFLWCRRLMVGVLASYRSLRGEPLSAYWRPQFPAPARIAALFPGNAWTLNLVHYSFHEEADEKELLPDLLRARELGGEHCHGLQLNLHWPPPAVLVDYREKYPDDTLVLQIGPRAMEQCDALPQLVARLGSYVGLVDRLLLDASGGRGQPFDPTSALEKLEAITGQFDDRFQLGVAGGLGPDTMELVWPVIHRFPSISFDAQGQLRDTGSNELCSAHLVDYLICAYHVLP